MTHESLSIDFSFARGMQQTVLASHAEPLTVKSKNQQMVTLFNDNMLVWYGNSSKGFSNIYAEIWKSNAQIWGSFRLMVKRMRSKLTMTKTFYHPRYKISYCLHKLKLLCITEQVYWHIIWNKNESGFVFRIMNQLIIKNAAS